MNIRKYIDIVEAESVDINQVAARLEFLPTRKKAIEYTYVEDGEQGKMPPLSYTKLNQDQLVVTYTADGKETEKQGRAGDVLISGPNRENYVIDAAKFGKLYQGTFGDKVIPEQTPRLVSAYSGPVVNFTAPWGESMILKSGDYLVKDGDSGYYRIAQDEYKKTYNPPGK